MYTAYSVTQLVCVCIIISLGNHSIMFYLNTVCLLTAVTFFTG